MPRKKVDFINIVDVESTCWDGDQPANEKSEIIEIGLTVFSLEDLSIVSSCQSRVVPEYSRVSEFCTNLTGLTAETLRRDGTTLALACDWIRRYADTKNRIWASYGDYDRNQFHLDCERKKVPYPFGPRHINIKTLNSIIRSMDVEVGLDEALARSGLGFEGIPHTGMCDSKNIARLLTALLTTARSGIY